MPSKILLIPTCLVHSLLFQYYIGTLGIFCTSDTFRYFLPQDLCITLADLFLLEPPFFARLTSFYSLEL